MTKKLTTLLATGALVLGLQQAQAVQITGSVDIVASGSSVVIDKSANTVTFIDENALPGNALVSNATDDFTGFIGQLATYANFTYNPLSVVNPLWTLVIGDGTLAGASFDLLSIDFINEAGAGLSLAGTGTIHAFGFDDTAGSWSFSADTANGGRFTFSSQTAAHVPDGGATALLLGLGFLGMGFIARRK